MSAQPEKAAAKPPISFAKPVATVAIAPTEGPSAGSCEHTLRVTLKLSASHPRHADKEQVAQMARRLLAGFAPKGGAPDPWRFGEVLETSRSRKHGAVTGVVAIEATAVWPGRPDDDAVGKLRDALGADGYRVAVRERRRCAEPACKIDAMLDWNQPSQVPVGWHSSGVCGGHNYRTCARCKSIYALSSTNSVGPAPSVHCEVCGLVIVEWGSSKLWNAALMTRVAFETSREGSHDDSSAS